MSRPCVLPSAFCTASAPRTSCLSQLDGWPMHSPTDASPVPSQVPAHGSGPMRFATPSPWRTLTTYSLPVSPAHTKQQPFCRLPLSCGPGHPIIRAFGAICGELILPLDQPAVGTVAFEQLGHVVLTLTVALAAGNAQQVELAVEVAERDGSAA